MRFVDYKCNDCNEINEYYISSEDTEKPVSYTHLDVYKRQR